MKKFWKKTEGFTLVELIVVIAILGILAGVGTVGYSGYVKKANMAADQQLLASLNQAFAVACIENGEDAVNVTANSITLTDGKVAETALAVSVPTEKADEIEASFWKYFSENKDSEFKVYQFLSYDQSKGMFENEEGESYNGFRYTQEAVDKYLQTTLGKNVGSAAMVGLVNNVTGSLGNTIGQVALPTALASGSYKDAAAKALGLADAAAYDAYILEQKNAAEQKYLEEAGYASMTNPVQKLQTEQAAKRAAEEAKSRIEKNLVAMVGAQNAQQAGGTILNILKGADAYNTISGNVKDASEKNNALGIAQSALAYALYESYVQNTPGVTASETDFVAQLSDPTSGFKAYLNDSSNSAQIQTDLEGYLVAMEMVGAQDVDVIKSVATEGFESSGLLGALEHIFGEGE